jgi:asparagine synthase (glutamine-hydrolysing)
MMLARYLGIIALTHGRLSFLSIDGVVTRFGLEQAHASHSSVLYTSGPVRALPGRHGRTHLVGHIFDRASNDDGVRLPDPARRYPPDFLDIIRHRWGAFMAWTEAETSDGVTIYREPSGRMPCYYRRFDDQIVVSSHMEMLEAITGRPEAINWSVVTNTLLYPDLQERDTALRGIREVLPGEILQVRDSRTHHHSLWNPSDVILQSRVSTFPEAVQRVGDAVRFSTRVWAQACGRSLLNLSGGLDSSVLAAAFVEASTSPECVTLVSSSGSGDERLFASLVCRDLGLALHQRRLLPGDVNIFYSAAANRPLPSTKSFTQSITSHNADLAREVEADAIFYGSGGDNVFCFLRSATPATDCLRTEGLRSGFARSVWNVATVTECSPWLILRTALSKAWARRQPWRWPRDEALLSPDLLAACSTPPDHPWVTAFADLPVGKREHVAAIMRGLALVDYLDADTGPAVIYPLLSQPVMEACLQIPTWLWYEGGINRAVIRQAFQKQLPSDILARSSKGGLTGLARQIYLANLPEIRTRLLDGELCRQGIVDRDALERSLAVVPLAGDHRFVRILRFVDVEAWLAARSSR